MRSANAKLAWTAALAAVSIWVGSVEATFAPGPDGFGYASAAVPFNLRDITGTGTVLFPAAADLSPCDDCITDAAGIGAIPIGFSFSFYGTTYTDVYISSNGFLTFDAGSSNGCCGGHAIPNTESDLDNAIYAWWTDDFDPGERLFYQTVGAPGSREFIVEYANFAYCCVEGDNTFEIILHETTNDIELQYGNTGFYADHFVTVGIEGIVPATEPIGPEQLGDPFALQLLNEDLSDTASPVLFGQQGFCVSTGSISCPTPAQVPEPTTLALVGIALAGLRYRCRMPRAPG